MTRFRRSSPTVDDRHESCLNERKINSKENQSNKENLLPKDECVSSPDELDFERFNEFWWRAKRDVDQIGDETLEKKKNKINFDFVKMKITRLFFFSTVCLTSLTQQFYSIRSSLTLSLVNWEKDSARIRAIDLLRTQCWSNLVVSMLVVAEQDLLY